MSAPRISMRRWVATAGGVVVGAVAVYCVVSQAGAAATSLFIARALPYLPLVALFEGARIVCEMGAARGLFAALRAPIPAAALARAQLAGYAVGSVMPMGRLAGEATKAAILAPAAGLPKTAAVAAISQALHLVASAVILAPAVLAARYGGTPAALALAILGQCAVLAGAGAAVLAASYFAPTAPRSPRFAKLGAALAAFRAAMRTLPRFPLAALAFLILNRALQVATMAVLLTAVGASPSWKAPLIANAALTIGASVGDLLPGQIGALEGALSVFASAIGVSRAAAAAVGLLLHLVQSGWVLAGIGVLLGGARRRGRRVKPPAPLGWAGAES